MQTHATLGLPVIATAIFSGLGAAYDDNCKGALNGPTRLDCIHLIDKIEHDTLLREARARAAAEESLNQCKAFALLAALAALAALVLVLVAGIAKFFGYM
ncbi:hypothetical protein F4778DRAFT_786251 [Xylariomycetidae sp. FL2044]|nr:hypothetical protein F4778DRAFT_786251 [Xylariomycetidae sp. FL2044]